MMDLQAKIELTKQNIRQALQDYGKHVRCCDEYRSVLEDVSSKFIDRLARDSVNAKQELRDMLRKSPVWDEQLDALVINGTRTHDPDYSRVDYLARTILHDAMTHSDGETCNDISNAIYFFSDPQADKDDRDYYLRALKKLAPRAYAANKKLSRVFKALCDALGVSDDTAGSAFQHNYAQLADELSSKKINFKLYVSINPAHFLTMSNPKGDERGDTMTSCHSFNSTEYEYNCGCSGYARDDVTMIAFTVSDSANPETLNNRKTTRQLYMYKPGNGLLLQSRMYNTSGGTRGAQAESKLYRDLIQREISACEGAINLWDTKTYYGSDIYIRCGEGFGGYPDWTYVDFAAKYSIRKDHMEDYETFRVGTYGLCIKCADTICERLYCEDCRYENDNVCDDCGEHCGELYDVHDRHGNVINVCESCRDDNYYYCTECGEYFVRDDVTELDDGDYVCDSCRDEYYDCCAECGDWFRADDMYSAIDERGSNIRICEHCRDNYYFECDECGEYIREDDAISAHRHGEDVRICEPCKEGQYVECESCDEIVHEDDVDENGNCENCRENEQEAEAV